jgi:hypothetical protein
LITLFFSCNFIPEKKYEYCGRQLAYNQFKQYLYLIYMQIENKQEYYHHFYRITFKRSKLKFREYETSRKSQVPQQTFMKTRSKRSAEVKMSTLTRYRHYHGNITDRDKRLSNVPSPQSQTMTDIARN